MSDLTPSNIYRGLPFSLTVRRATSDLDANGDVDGTQTYTDLTGYTVYAQGVTAVNDESVPADLDDRERVTFTATVADPQTGSSLGKFTLSLTADQTAALDAGDKLAVEYVLRNAASVLETSPGPRLWFVVKDAIAEDYS